VLGHDVVPPVVGIDLDAQVGVSRQQVGHARPRHAIDDVVDGGDAIKPAGLPPRSLRPAMSTALSAKRGATVSITLSDPTTGGINLNPDRRVAARDSSTTDISWNVQWRVTPQWTIRNDVQGVRAKTRALDSDVATGLKLQKQNLDLTGSLPRLNFDDADRAAIADPKNYYWAYTMEHLDKSTASNNVWKTDVQYDFDDKVLRDIRFGVRFTDRESNTRNPNPSCNWQAVTQPWMGELKSLASLGDPRFNSEARLHQFTNFFNGSVSVPSAVFPSDAVARAYPGSYATLHSYYDILCQEAGGNNCRTFAPATFGTDPAENNNVREKTKALYTQVRFAFGDQHLAYGLPLWAEAYGQLDGSIFYKITDQLTLGLEAQNLSNARFRQTMQQHIGNMEHTWFATGRRYAAKLSYNF
jgi:hypothetical protein